MEQSKEGRAGSRWPVSLPRIDTSRPSSRLSDSRHEPVPAHDHRDVAAEHDRETARPHNNHGHHHHSLRHRRHGHRRQRTKDAIQAPLSLDYNPFLRAAFGSSRVDTSTETNTQQSTLDRDAEIRKVETTPSDVRLERDNRLPREQGVSMALDDLLQQAQDATRRLDDTYYELLSRNSDLKAHMASLNQLRQSVKAGLSGFEQDTAATTKALHGAIDKFDGFRVQKKSIESLCSRLERGQTRARELEGQLGSVGERLRKWEAKEKVYQKDRSARWRATAGVVATVLVIGIALLLWAPVSRIGVEYFWRTRWRGLGEGVYKSTHAWVDEMRGERHDDGHADRLRVFDEL